MSYGFVYRSRFGLLAIRPARNGRWNLWIGDDIYGQYHSPIAAADDVYMQATGHYEWDDQDNLMEPCDLSEWTRVSIR